MKASTEFGVVSHDEALPASVVGRVTRVAFAVLVALALAAVVSVLGGDGSEAPGGHFGGDLPAFYGAGRIAADGDWDALYDAGTQVAAQADLWETQGEYLYFAYPPQVAAAYRTLVPFGYRAAYLFHTLLMAGAVLASVWLARPMFGWLRRLPLVVPFAVAVTFYPLLRAVIGGQNSALTLLLFVAVLRLEDEHRPIASGAVAGLLLYKPQFGIPLALLIVVGRSWRMFGGWAGTALLVYAGGVATLGRDWIGEWWRQAIDFSDLNVSANGANFISIPGVVAHLLGTDAGTAVLAAVAVVAGGAAALAWWFLREDVTLRMAVAVAVIVAIAPQALFYEAGVLLLPIALLATRYSKWLMRIVGVAWAAGLVHLAASLLDWSPLVLFVVAVAGWTLALAAVSVQERLSSV